MSSAGAPLGPVASRRSPTPILAMAGTAIAVSPLLAGRGRISRRLLPLSALSPRNATWPSSSPPPTRPTRAPRRCSSRTSCDCEGQASLPAGAKMLSAAGQRYGWRASRPIGRVLCTHVSGPTAIHLGLPLPAASCGLPASIGRAVLKRSRRKRAPTVPLPSWPCSGWGLPSRPGHPGRWWSLTPPFHPYSPGQPPAGPERRSVFCGTVPRVTRVGVTDHPALRSRTFLTAHRAARPPGRLARHRQDRTCRP